MRVCWKTNHQPKHNQADKAKQQMAPSTEEKTLSEIAILVKSLDKIGKAQGGNDVKDNGNQPSSSDGD